MAAPSSRTVLHRLALVAMVSMAAIGVWLRDPEAGAFAVLILVGILLLAVRRGLLGRILLVLIFLDTAAWMAPAAFSNVRHAESLPYVVFPVWLAALSVVGVLVAVGLGRKIVVLGLLVAVAAVAVSRVPSTGAKEAQARNAIRVNQKNVAFSPTLVDAVAGKITVDVHNHDLFWHTFTIDALHVDVRVPMGATRQVSIKNAKPGRYEFYCRIPGHKQAGMKGTLVVT